MPFLRRLKAGSVFISYRRTDRDFVDALQAEIERAYGNGVVFRDVRSIEPGAAFPAGIETALDNARLVLAVIGPTWLERLQKPPPSGQDFLRLELAGASRRGVTVLPLLIKGTTMPEAAQLPDDVRFVASCQA